MRAVTPAHVTYGDERVHMEFLYEPDELVKYHRPSYTGPKNKQQLKPGLSLRIMPEGTFQPTMHISKRQRVGNFLPSTLDKTQFDFSILPEEREAEDKAALEKAAVSRGKGKATCEAKGKQASAIGYPRNPDACPRPGTRAYTLLMMLSRFLRTFQVLVPCRPQSLSSWCYRLLSGPSMSIRASFVG